MTSQLFISPDEPQILSTTLSMPYTLTTGHAASTFLKALAGQRLVGSRCTACERTVVPAQDVCVHCGLAMTELIDLPHSGAVSSWTSTPDGTVAKIRIDGTDTDLLHRIIGVERSSLKVGMRVNATWSTEPTGWITDLAGFTAGEATTGPAGSVTSATVVEPIEMLPYKIDLAYKHSYGPYYGRMFDMLGSEGRLMGTRCSNCQRVLLPARAICDVCFAPTDKFDEVSDTGVLQAFSIIHMEFVGQTRKPPYVYAEIVLDGCATRLIHNVAGDFDVANADEHLKVGMKVKAVWRDVEQRVGTLEDIDFFEPVLDAEFGDVL